MTFSMKDRSTQPYAWMLENVDPNDIAEMGAEEYVKAMAEQAIDGMGFDTTVEEWISGTVEFEEAVNYVRQEIESQS